MAVGTACNRPDLRDLRLAGVVDVVAHDEAGPGGFLVPHSARSRIDYGSNGSATVAAAEARRFADVLSSDLARRASWDSSGARWHNVEHREQAPVLPAQTGWAMGDAGIVRELLRYDRILEGRDPAYALDWPDHPPAA